MKHILLIAVLILSACSKNDNEFMQAVAFGEIKELNRLSPGVDKQLIVRLFQAPQFIAGCFKETHGVCQYKYFVSVSSYDEYPEFNLYELDAQGEVGKIIWISTDLIDTAIIEFDMNSYTQHALNNNKQLKNTKKKLRVELTPKRIRESISP